MRATTKAPAAWPPPTGAADHPSNDPAPAAPGRRLQTPTIRNALPADVDDAPRGWPRLLSRKLAGAYLSCSEREIDRLIAVGAIGIVRLPVTRHAKRNVPTSGKNRRVHVDRAELDALIVKNREQVGR